ncbi:MAG: hypothetical protein E5X54_32590 [Mesorhizobium sp.]|nr:MAG: hypothetical protein E5X54_32590 [Mesorhizobium sp.]
MDVTSAFANHQRWKASETSKLPISPLEGEMSGRTEGGRRDRTRPPAADQSWRFTRGVCRLRRHLPLKGGDYILRANAHTISGYSSSLLRSRHRP